MNFDLFLQVMMYVFIATSVLILINAAYMYYWEDALSKALVMIMGSMLLWMGYFLIPFLLHILTLNNSGSINLFGMLMNMFAGFAIYALITTIVFVIAKKIHGQCVEASSVSK